MDTKNWIHLAKHITIVEGQDVSTHSIQTYTDGSKNEEGVGSGIAVFAGGNLKTTLRYRLSEWGTNNQPEQMPILKAMEYIQQISIEEKTALVYTDSRITLQLLKTTNDILI
jgi:ribonuclease HI